MEGGASVAATGIKIVAKNQKAYHEYFIEEKFETGIELSGTEVKSIRLGNLSLKEAWCQIKDGELFIRQMHIAPYEQGNIFNKDPLRPRRLLMHKREIARLFGKVKQMQNEESDEFRIFSFGAVNRNVYKKSGSKIKQAMIQ